MRAGEEGDGAYLIVSGNVQRLEPSDDAKTNNSKGNNSSKIDVETPPGTLLAEMSMLIDEHYHGATFVAKGRVHAFKLSRSALHAQMESDPDLAAHFVQIIVGRLQDLAKELRRIDQILAPKPPSLAVRITANTAERTMRQAVG